MSPEVIARKLARLEKYLRDLKTFMKLSTKKQKKEQYSIERLCQLIVEVLSDLTSHVLSDWHNISAGGYKEVFKQAGVANIYSHDLAEELQKAAGLRNLLVHLYEEIDSDKLSLAVPRLMDAAEQAAVKLARFLEQEKK